MDYKVKDSGQRQSFASGAVRDCVSGKGRYDLISPIALRRLAKHYEKGAVKYGDNNWTKGIPIKRLIESVIRHLNEYLMGNREEDNIIAAAWGCFAIVHTEEMILNGKMSPDLVKDLPCYIAEKDMDENTKRWWDEMHKLLESQDKFKENNLQYEKNVKHYEDEIKQSRRSKKPKWEKEQEKAVREHTKDKKRVTELQEINLSQIQKNESKI